MRAIVISEWGGPEVLELVEDAEVPEPGEGQVLIRVSAALASADSFGSNVSKTLRSVCSVWRMLTSRS